MEDTEAMTERKIITVTLEDQSNPQGIPISTPKRRNRVVTDRGDGRCWTPPPTAREWTRAHPLRGFPGITQSSSPRGSTDSGRTTKRKN